MASKIDGFGAYRSVFRPRMKVPWRNNRHIQPNAAPCARSNLPFGIARSTRRQLRALGWSQGASSSPRRLRDASHRGRLNTAGRLLVLSTEYAIRQREAKQGFTMKKILTS